MKTCSKCGKPYGGEHDICPACAPVISESQINAADSAAENVTADSCPPAADGETPQTYPFIERRRKPRPANLPKVSRSFGANESSSFFYDYEDPAYVPSMLASALASGPASVPAQESAQPGQASPDPVPVEDESNIPIWLRKNSDLYTDDKVEDTRI